MIMKKYFCYIFLSLSLIFAFQTSFADIINIPFTPDIEDVSIEYKWWFGGSLVDSVNSLGFSILNTIKVILAWVLLIYVVYIGIQMIISLWSDEDQLSTAKKTTGIYYICTCVYQYTRHTLWGIL